MDMDNINRRDRFSGVLFSDPTHFQVNDTDSFDKTINRINGAETEARIQWADSVSTAMKYTHVHTVDYEVYSHIQPPIYELPYAVFVSNHGMPIPDTGFIVSNMKHEKRRGESLYFKEWANNHNHELFELDDGIIFEGSGDAKWHPKKNLVWVGYGQRTDKKAIQEIDTIVDATVVGLELQSPKYFHLDLCFTPLDENTVLVIPEAFTDEAYDKIMNGFDQVLHVTDSEKSTMAGNCSLIAEKTVLMDKQNKQTARTIHKNGITVIAVNTKEFQKVGGSIDCLNLKIP